MLNTEVLERLDALLAYCEAHEDGESDWHMLHRLLAAVRGAAGAGPELQGLYEHLRPYSDARLERLLEGEEGDAAPRQSYKLTPEDVARGLEHFITWTAGPLPPPVDHDPSQPYATHEGVLALPDGTQISCLQLNTGERVFEAEAVGRWLGLKDTV